MPISFNTIPSNWRPRPLYGLTICRKLVLPYHFVQPALVVGTKMASGIGVPSCRSRWARRRS